MRKEDKLEDFEEGVGADELAFGTFVEGHESGLLHADLVLGGVAGVAEEQEGGGGRLRADAGDWYCHIYLYDPTWTLSLKHNLHLGLFSASQTHLFKFTETYSAWKER